MIAFGPPHWGVRILGRSGVRGSHALLIACLACLISFQPARADWIATAMASGERAYARADYVRAADAFMPPAQSGLAKAQTYIGYMYANGLGLPQDFVKAVDWLTRAAQQGAPTAQFLLAGLYDRGQGVGVDFVTAEVWYILAAAHAEPGKREHWARMRDNVAGKMTRADVAEAQARAAAWAPVASR